MILDLFRGPGGWSEGLKMLGLSDIGIEWDSAACRTAKAAGHLGIQADVSTYPTHPFIGKVEGLIASPPCQDFSLAGLQRGIEGDKGRLVTEVMRWTRDLLPAWIACEQVPPVEPIWQMFAYEMRALGYRTWVGTLNAADYGVPQTRRRTFLLASRRPVTPPDPTHARDVAHDGLFGPGLLPWVTMADALGWNAPVVYVNGNQRNAARRPMDAPAPTVHFGAAMNDVRWVVRTGANSMKHSRTGSRAGDGGVVPYERSVDEPAPTLDSKVGSAWKVGPDWAFERPSTTVVGSFCPDIIAAPGYRTTVSRQDAPDSVRVSLQEAAVLQSFRPDYPWQGSKTKCFEQVGNAVPPLLAAHVLAAVTGLTIRAKEVAA